MTQEKTVNAMSGGLALLALLGALALGVTLFLGGIASDDRSQSLPECCWL